jgi:hypothetical protein
MKTRRFKFNIIMISKHQDTNTIRILTAAQQPYTPWSSGSPPDSLDEVLAWEQVVAGLHLLLGSAQDVDLREL